MITDEDHRLLLCRLCPLEVNKGKWTLPGGGVNFGENLISAVQREVYEETGLTVKVTGLADAHSDHFVHADRELHAVRIVYWADVVEGELRQETNGSTDDCQYFALDEIHNLPVVTLVKRGVGIVKGRRRFAKSSR
ncbi:MAG: NUDIX domain-containing protein [Chthonomonadaceae bacterium]|nr:NUDIX domain-containing protein [Chthonomonadaceae bacterium]